MTLTAPATALPLFGTVAYEPAAEARVSLVADEWLVEGDPAPDGAATPAGGGAGELAAAPPTTAGESAIGNSPVGDSPVGGSPVGGWAVGGWAVADAAVGSAGGGDPCASDRHCRPGHATDPRRRRERERALSARRRAELVVRTALEVLDGRRPVRQLAPFATPQVLRYVNAGVPRRGDPTAGASLRSLHVSLPARTAAEVAAVCRFGTRVRAVAARLELTGRGEWRCVALRVI